MIGTHLCLRVVIKRKKFFTSSSGHLETYPPEIQVKVKVTFSPLPVSAGSVACLTEGSWNGRVLVC